MAMPPPSPLPTPDRQAVLAALDAVLDPRSGRGLASTGLVQGLSLRPGRAGFMLEAPAAQVALYEPVRAAAEQALLGVAGVAQAQVVLTAEGGRGVPPEPARDPALAVQPRARLSPDAQASLHPARPAAAQKPAYVRRVIAVASGKGGVGKSTVAVNLAVALGRLGLRVGLLDADVYGPSAPRMLGLDAEPALNADRKLVPLEAFGIRAVSIGLLVDEGAPMIWRGPMASSALNQLLNDVAWGSEAEPLDVLVVDMPPGTGDIQLTLAQKVAVDGAVIVSTPQEVALIDVRRGAAMFAKTATPLLGVVENMAYFPDPSTGAPIPIFGRGGARGVAEELGAPFLGEVPIDQRLRESGDAGAPLAFTDPDSPVGRLFAHMAVTIAAALEAGGGGKPAPRIVIE